VIELSVFGLAKFMTSSPSQQRRDLGLLKHPNPIAAAREDYYDEARAAIREYHGIDADPETLDLAISRLGQRAGESDLDEKQITRLQQNARVLMQYGDAFGGKQYELLDEVSLYLEYGDVRVRMTPDLHVVEDGQEGFIKFEFSAAGRKSEWTKLVCECFAEAMRASGFDLPPESAQYVDIPRGIVHAGQPFGRHTETNVEATCLNIVGIWETV